MSDVEDGDFRGRESRSPSKSDGDSPVHAKNESRSATPSASHASKRSGSQSRSRSKSRSPSRRQSHRRSLTHAPTAQSTGARGARAPPPRPPATGTRAAGTDSARTSKKKKKETYSHGDARILSSASHSTPSQANPDPNTCLGVFGLSLYTTERDLREVFSRYGPLAGVNVVYDQRTGRSRGFAFVYFERIDDAKEAMERANGMELDGRRIRVDYSITKRPHTPTPGIYMGRPTQTGYHLTIGLTVVVLEEEEEEEEEEGGRGRRWWWGSSSGGRRRDYERGYDRYDEYDYRYSRRRSPSPYYSRYRSRSRSRSYSPRRY
ncbi:hypothetical protein AAFF_G00307580 [Aldrovandia affinis]|uniref:RRM domain-containing protein n=1 Tax=Aldrovandia affinis TaxID=143900 RepID=A0AAD7W041_9TELE|nr:hypothetical protein AAFF_G00307580 [Aldrovandia affinis]